MVCALRYGTRKARIGGFAVAAVLTVLAWAILEVWWNPFPDRVMPVVYLAGGGAVACLAGVVTHRGRRVVMAAATIGALIGALGVFNLIYQQYPTVRSLSAQLNAQSMTYEQFRTVTAAPQRDGGPVGALVDVDLPGSFAARTAVAWVPPAYWTQPQRQLPVLVLMAGNPGRPQQWFSNGAAVATADEYQATHNGVAPIIVSVDGTGSFTGNPLCTDSSEGAVMTYLSTDVPAAIKERFRVNPDQSTWTIGGLSYGGTCALQVATAHPRAYGNFLDFSGQAEPTLGDHQATVEHFFDGDEERFQDINPATLLARGNPDFAHVAGRFVAGEKDKESRAALTELNDAARAAGMDTTFTTVRGGHSYQVWREALRHTFDWVARGGRLAECPDSFPPSGGARPPLLSWRP